LEFTIHPVCRLFKLLKSTVPIVFGMVLSKSFGSKFIVVINTRNHTRIYGNDVIKEEKQITNDEKIWAWCDLFTASLNNLKHNIK
jgi:hypothetical protein